MKKSFFFKLLFGLLLFIVAGTFSNDAATASFVSVFALTIPAGLTASEFLRQLREERAPLLAEMKTLTEMEELDDTQQARFDELDGLIKDLDTKIEAVQKMVDLNKRKAGYKTRLDNAAPGVQQISNEEAETVKRFSFSKFIREAGASHGLTGLEKEMHEEAVKEAKETEGVSIKNFGVPSMIIGAGRDMTVGTSTAGGNLLQDEPLMYLEALWYRLVLRDLGADFLTGLVGNLPISSENAVAAAAWADENGTASESSPTFAKVTMSPKRLATFVDVSKQLLIQDSIGVENRLRNQLINAAAIALQLAAINGSGTAPTPRGILNTSGIGSVALGTDGLAPTWASIVGLETAVAEDNADVGALGYLTNAKVRGTLKSTEKASSTARYIMEGADLNGYKVGVTNQVPSNLTKGSGTNLSALIFGNFRDLVIGQWGGLDVMVNPYTKSKDGLIEVQIDGFHDVAVLRPESFAACVDIITT